MSRRDRARMMPAQAPADGRRLLRLVASGIQDFLIEPAEPPLPADAGAEPAEPPLPVEAGAEPAVAPPRPVVAVFGLARRCGATVVARALAAELAGRDPAGTAAVASGSVSGGIPLATAAAGRLATSLREVPGASTTAVGRICLVDGADAGALAGVARHHAPLVLDAGTSSLDDGAVAVADSVLLVATPRIQPALARVAADCVRRSGAHAAVVVNRSPAAAIGRVRTTAVGGSPAAAVDGSAAAAVEGSAAGMNDGSAVAPSRSPLQGGDVPFPAVTLPESRMGAQLALGGRLARGELGRAIAALGDRCEAAV